MIGWRYESGAELPLSIAYNGTYSTVVETSLQAQRYYYYYYYLLYPRESLIVVTLASFYRLLCSLPPTLSLCWSPCSTTY